VAYAGVEDAEAIGLEHGERRGDAINNPEARLRGGSKTV